MAKTTKKRKKPVQVVDAGTVERPEFVTDPEVYQDFQEQDGSKPTADKPSKRVPQPEYREEMWTLQQRKPREKRRSEDRPLRRIKTL